MRNNEMNMQAQFTTRQAVAGDAAHLARLIDIAGEGIPSWLWARSCREDQSALDVGIERARREQGGFSYRNALVAREGKHAVGMVLSYPITTAPDDLPDEVPEPLAPFVDLEMRSVGTWYINALATYPGHRGRGIGTGLLMAAEARAARSGHAEMSIQVYGQNTGALSLYLRSGYGIAARSPVRLHPCQPYYTGDVLLLKKRVVRQAP